MEYVKEIGLICLKREIVSKEGDVPELFNLKRDIGETNNLHLEYPEKVKELQEVMQLYQALKVKK